MCHWLADVCKYIFGYNSETPGPIWTKLGHMTYCWIPLLTMKQQLKLLTDVPLARRCVILLTHVEINSLKLVIHLGSYIAPRLDSMSYLEMACRFVTGSLMCHPAYRCARLTTIIA